MSKKKDPNEEIVFRVATLFFEGMSVREIAERVNAELRPEQTAQPRERLPAAGRGAATELCPAGGALEGRLAGEIAEKFACRSAAHYGRPHAGKAPQPIRRRSSGRGCLGLDPRYRRLVGRDRGIGPWSRSSDAGLFAVPERAFALRKQRAENQALRHLRGQSGRPPGILFYKLLQPLSPGKGRRARRSFRRDRRPHRGI